jgi:hypothetical protein
MATCCALFVPAPYGSLGTFRLRISLGISSPITAPGDPIPQPVPHNPRCCYVFVSYLGHLVEVITMGVDVDVDLCDL